MTRIAVIPDQIAGIALSTALRAVPPSLRSGQALPRSADGPRGRRTPAPFSPPARRGGGGPCKAWWRGLARPITPATNRSRFATPFFAAAAVWCASARTATAAFASRPFAVAGGEGGGGAHGGLVGWLMGEQSRLTHAMAAQIHALHGESNAALWLGALGLAYGVVHAAGPGHGKAVIASYMLANERSLKRGVLLSLLAALLQAAVAIALVGAAAFVFNATASEMNAAANWTALASYCGVAAIGLWLVWRKGGALIAALGRYVEQNRALPPEPALVGHAWSEPRFVLPSFAFRAFSPNGEAPADATDACGCVHAADPAALEKPFSWRDAAGTVIAAGVRPCSGAILVLVFALAQGLFAAGVGAALAMAFGTAVTTAALAAIAVFFKQAALRLAAGENSRMALVARTFEFAAALAVLALGVALLWLGSNVA